MIVTIDGPAGAGKSSVARSVARRLGFEFLDTGAMYRAVTWAAVDANHDWSDPQALVELASRLDIQLRDDRVFVNDRDISSLIRSSQITGLIHYAANNPGVRAILVDLQRRVALNRDMVTEGRDQGTVAFPHAECKLFLTASPEERARRRLRDLHARHEFVTFEEVLRQQNERDARDAQRAVGPLRAAEDAIEVPTDDLTQDQVIDRLERIVRERMAALQSGSPPPPLPPPPPSHHHPPPPPPSPPASRIGPVLGLLVTVVGLAAGLAARSNTSLAQGLEAAPAAALIERQRQVERRYHDMLAKYQQLAQSLESTEPEQSQRIAKTLARAKELLFEKRLAAVSERLRAGQLPAAMDEQQQILADLGRLLRTLQTGEDASDDAPDVSDELVQRLQDMLSRQKPVTAATLDLSSRQPADGNWRRADRLLLARQADEQKQLTTLADEALALIESAESADVVRSLLDAVRADMQQAAGALAERRVTNDVLAAQNSAEATLADLIRSIARNKPMPDQRGESPSAAAGEPGAAPPLLPPSAALKLLRTTQDRLEQRTSALEARRAKTASLTDADRRELAELVKRQEEIEQLVGAMLP